MRIRAFIPFCLLLGSLIPADMAMAALKWEVVRTEVIDAKSVLKEAELEIKTSDNALIISTNHSIKIQVFTILGRLLISESIPAGTSRLQLPAHGVYIVKTGSITCKVAI